MPRRKRKSTENPPKTRWSKVDPTVGDPEKRKQVYRELGITSWEQAAPRIHWIARPFIEDNIAFCREHDIDFNRNPKMLTASDLRLRERILSEVLEGRYQVNPGDIGNSCNYHMDSWSFTPADKSEFLDALMTETAGESRITEQERDILDLRFGLNETPGQDHPHTLVELRDDHDVKKKQVRELENRALLGCKHPACANTRAAHLIQERIARSAMVEVPVYYSVDSIEHEPVRAPSLLAYEVKSMLLEEHWDELDESMRQLGKGKLMELSINDLVRGAFKRTGEQERQMLAELYGFAGVKHPENDVLLKTDVDRNIAGLDHLKQQQLRGDIQPTLIPVRAVPDKIEVFRSFLGPEMMYTRLASHIPEVLGRAQLTDQDIVQLFDAMEACELPAKYRITEKERELLCQRFGVSGHPRLPMGGFFGKNKAHVREYVNWLEYTAVLAALSPEAKDLGAHAKMMAYAGKNQGPVKVPVDDYLEITWLADHLLTAEGRAEYGVMDRKQELQWQRIGWRHGLCELTSSFRRACDIRLAVDDDCFTEEGGVADGSQDRIAALHLTDADRQRIREYLELRGQVKTIGATKKRLEKAGDDQKEELEEQLARLVKVRSIEKPLEGTVRRLLDFRCRRAEDGSEIGMVIGKELKGELEVSSQRINQHDNKMIEKIGPFMCERDFTVELAETYGGVLAIPPDVLEAAGLEVAVVYAPWSQELDEQRRSKALKVWESERETKSMDDLKLGELLSHRKLRSTSTHVDRVDKRVATARGYREVKRKVKTKRMHLVEIPRSEFPQVVIDEQFEDPTDLLVPNRFQYLERPDGNFIEDIPFYRFPDALVELYGSPTGIPPEVLVEHGLGLRLKYRGSEDIDLTVQELANVAERELRPIEPKQDDELGVDVPILEKRIRRSRRTSEADVSRLLETTEEPPKRRRRRAPKAKKPPEPAVEVLLPTEPVETVVERPPAEPTVSAEEPAPGPEEEKVEAAPPEPTPQPPPAKPTTEPAEAPPEPPAQFTVEEPSEKVVEPAPKPAEALPGEAVEAAPVGPTPPPPTKEPVETAAEEPAPMEPTTEPPRPPPTTEEDVGEPPIAFSDIVGKEDYEQSPLKALEDNLTPTQLNQVCESVLEHANELDPILARRPSDKFAVRRFDSRLAVTAAWETPACERVVELMESNFREDERLQDSLDSTGKVRRYLQEQRKHQSSSSDAARRFRQRLIRHVGASKEQLTGFHERLSGDKPTTRQLIEEWTSGLQQVS